MTTYREARNEINGAFLERWNAETAVIVGYVPEVRWQGVQERGLPDGSKFWVRVSAQSVQESQTTFAEVGKQRFTGTGLVFVQLFCPKSDSQCYDKGLKLAEVAKSAFRGKSANGVWFRNTTIRELPQEEVFERFNVIAEFEFDEIA
jgi:hypothetical protein